MPVLNLFHQPAGRFFNLRNIAARLMFPFIVCVCLVAAQTGIAESGSPDIVVGKVRVQLLSGSLVRLELRGPEGFENRATFHVVNRDWPGTAFTTNTDAGNVVIRTANLYGARSSKRQLAGRGAGGIHQRTIALCL